MSYKDSFIWQAFQAISVALTVWISLFYVIWLNRGIADGELITGVIMCLCFGCIWIYLARAWEDWCRHKSKLQTTLGILIAGYFGYLWYLLLKALNNHLVTGEPLPLAVPDYKGIFNIEGFWGLGIIIPIYIVFMLLIVIVVWAWDKWFNRRYNWTNRRYQQIKHKLEGR